MYICNTMIDGYAYNEHLDLIAIRGNINPLRTIRFLKIRFFND